VLSTIFMPLLVVLWHPFGLAAGARGLIPPVF